MARTSQWPVPANSTRYVIPEPMVALLADNPLTNDLYPLAFGHYRIARGHHMQRPSHNDHLLIYCTDGRAYLHANGEAVTVEAGDLLLLPRGMAHRYSADPEHPWTIYWVHYSGALAPAFAAHMGFGEGVCLSVGQQPRLLLDFSGLLAVQQTGFRLQELVHSASRLRQLLASVPLYARADHTRQPFSLETIHDYMKANLEQRLTLEELASLAGLSPAHFATRYRRMTGVSPVQHFLHLKVERACQLMDTTTDSFRAISAQLGYDDSYYFSRLFKKIMGQAPAVYRHTHRH
ncbi:AraC family transcriptional regulator [Marinobacter sp. X15-166B]|uniref:AraC family transcriptional regulator n=1 Tax=Marinobacter sp. X15-166B TaxID=1897620 RepID=UPI00085BDE81|nr:AraC family ligand binding domain-containing protein [Marinobacter sp. X15-166B]OEY66285.1 AraC family transcriptional regulator [Marinobacter sp. X15-166B]